MQILPKLDSGNAPDGYLPPLERSVSPAQPFSDVMNRLIDKARELNNQENGDNTHSQKVSAKGGSQKHSAKSTKKNGKSNGSESAIPSDITVDRETLAGIKKKLKEYGMSDESISEIADEIASEGEISWKRLNKIISNKLELSDENFDPELTQQEQTELLSFFQKLNFTVDQSNRLLDAISGTDEAEDAWALIRKHLNALSDDSLKTVTKSEVNALGKALGVSGSTQLTDALMGEAGAGAGDGSKVKNAVNLLFQQSDEQNSYLSEKAAALKDILHTGLQAATKRGENSMLADNRSSKEVDNAKVRIEDGAEKNYGEKKTALGGDPSEASNKQNASSNGRKNDAPVTQEKAQVKNAGLPEQVGKASATAQDSTEKVDESANEKSKAAVLAGAESGKQDKPEKAGLNHKEIETDRNSKIAAHQNSAEHSDSTGKRFDAEGGDSQGKSGDGNKNVLNDKNSGQTAASAAKEEKTETQKAWEELLSKVEVEEGSVLQTQGTQQTNGSSNAVAAGKQEISAARIMRTVENGVLSNTGQGRTQLTIRLDPPNLGQLTVSLQVKNDEVQAIIKTDSEEVGKMISDHLNLLRHSLEQHGLKVEKLNVQTQTQNNEGDKGWQSAEQHNQAQQQSQRNQLRSSIRTLQNLSMQGESLSQEALDATSSSANNDGLHLIA